jgi:hypothetical protein
MSEGIERHIVRNNDLSVFNFENITEIKGINRKKGWCIDIIDKKTDPHLITNQILKTKKQQI